MNGLLKSVCTLLALIWLPAVSCCLVDASGLLGKQDCCAKEQSGPVPEPGECGKPCGTLASAPYLLQQAESIVFAPTVVPSFDNASAVVEVRYLDPGIGRDLPATGPPPEPAVPWQFSFRTALSPRAPSFHS